MNGLTDKERGLFDREIATGPRSHSPVVMAHGELVDQEALSFRELEPPHQH